VDLRHSGRKSGDPRAYRCGAALAAKNRPRQLGRWLGGGGVDKKCADRLADGLRPFYGVRVEPGENPVCD